MNICLRVALIVNNNNILYCCEAKRCSYSITNQRCKQIKKDIVRNLKKRDFAATWCGFVGLRPKFNIRLDDYLPPGNGQNAFPGHNAFRTYHPPDITPPPFLTCQPLPLPEADKTSIAISLLVKITHYKGQFQSQDLSVQGQDQGHGLRRYGQCQNQDFYAH